MGGFTERLRTALRDPSVTRKLYAVTLAATLLVLVLTVKGPEQKGRLMVTEDGRVKGIIRNSVTSSEMYDLKLSISEGGEIIEREVTLTMQAVKAEGSDAKDEADGKPDRKAELDSKIDIMLNEIEYSDRKKVMLPDKLDDGTPVRWTSDMHGSKRNLILIPLMYIMLIVIIVRTSMSNENKDELIMQKEILRGLPRFCNQMFLMMNAGMILSDSFETICRSYKEFGTGNMTVFERELTGICDENRDHRISTAALLSEFASIHNVKEMTRIAAILTENEKRGSGVVDSLSRESKYLWDDRKIRARESGKLIDTKMSYPLSMLLILLIIITTAPALLSI